MTHVAAQQQPPPVVLPPRPRRRRCLVAQGRVDAVHVDDARRRRVDDGVVLQAGGRQQPVGGVGDDPMVPPRLEHPGVIGLVIGHRVPDL